MSSSLLSIYAENEHRENKEGKQISNIFQFVCYSTKTVQILPVLKNNYVTNTAPSVLTIAPPLHACRFGRRENVAAHLVHAYGL